MAHRGEGNDSGTAGQVRCVADGSAGCLSPDSPAKQNAISLSMFRQLDEGLTRFADDPEIRSVILCGVGGRAFCAGGDISEFQTLRTGVEAIAIYDRTGQGALKTLRQFPKPTVAMIEGYGLGGGMAIALNCDLRIASSEARLGIPAAERGQSYDYQSIKLLVDLVGPSAAKSILYTGRKFGADEALCIGLVNEIVPAGELKTHVTKIADRIATNAPLSIAASKFIVDTATSDSDQRDLDSCEAWVVKCLTSEDYAEANRAFVERRRPVFRGR